jgi:acetoin utilization deacetylase AcuC-like enzyme
MSNQSITADPLGGGNATRKSKVSYYFDEEFSLYQVSNTHPMKPFRIKMTDSLIKTYEMDKKMEPIQIDEDFVREVDLTKFHSDDYIDCLRSISIVNKEKYLD